MQKLKRGFGEFFVSYNRSIVAHLQRANNVGSCPLLTIEIKYGTRCLWFKNPQEVSDENRCCCIVGFVYQLFGAEPRFVCFDAENYG